MLIPRKECIGDIYWSSILDVFPETILYSPNRTMLWQVGSRTSHICYTHSSSWASGILFLTPLVIITSKVWGAGLIDWLNRLSDLT